jgi:hypothetical protein
MTWWAWVLVGWALLALPFALWLGGAARLIRRREPVTEEPLEPLTVPDVLAAGRPGRRTARARRAAPLPRPRTGRFSAGSREAPRR